MVIGFVFDVAVMGTQLARMLFTSCFVGALADRVY
jgi:hypothetical protein